jgi:hypothetical protein
MSENDLIQQRIVALEQQRDQALLNLGGINGQLRVWRELLTTMSEQREPNAVDRAVGSTTE